MTAGTSETVALITGANRGIGYAVACGLADLGYVVLIGARNPGNGRAAAERLVAKGAKADFIELDVTSDSSIDSAVREIEARYGRLDVLVNNAAVMPELPPSPPSASSIALVRHTYETNVFGAIAVLLATLPLLRRAPAARVVNVSSKLGSISLTTPLGTRRNPPLLTYGTSKAALNSVTACIAAELAGTSVKVNSVDPGLTNTEMSRGRGTRSPAQAAATIVYYATLPADGPTGGYFSEEGAVPW